MPYGGNKDAAAAVGKAIAERALAAGIKQVRFDRGSTSITAAWPPWPTPPAKRVWTFSSRFADTVRVDTSAEFQTELSGVSREQPNRVDRRRLQRMIDKVVKIRRCAAVVKGGRRFSFAAMVVVGDGRGKVGWGYGKANEVPPSVEKAIKEAAREMVECPSWTGRFRTPSRAVSARPR